MPRYKHYTEDEYLQCSKCTNQYFTERVLKEKIKTVCTKCKTKGLEFYPPSYDDEIMTIDATKRFKREMRK